ncbi:hypothetical protein J6590_103877 [Homalodisca vitripennis]|nr:hypothetical protein J6590_103877 [Homalodisca vitripennis]
MPYPIQTGPGVLGAVLAFRIVLDRPAEDVHYQVSQCPAERQPTAVRDDDWRVYVRGGSQEECTILKALRSFSRPWPMRMVSSFMNSMDVAWSKALSYPVVQFGGRNYCVNLDRFDAGPNSFPFTELPPHGDSTRSGSSSHAPDISSSSLLEYTEESVRAEVGTGLMFRELVWLGSVSPRALDFVVLLALPAVFRVDGNALYRVETLPNISQERKQSFIHPQTPYADPVLKETSSSVTLTAQTRKGIELIVPSLILQATISSSPSSQFSPKDAGESDAKTNIRVVVTPTVCYSRPVLQVLRFYSRQMLQSSGATGLKVLQSSDATVVRCYRS